jgi:hypothetical protein
VQVLATHLLENLLLPLFRGSLVGRVGTQERLSPGLALFLLAQVFHIFSHKVRSLLVSVLFPSRSLAYHSFALSTIQRLIDTLGAAIIHPNPTTYIHQMLKQTDSSKNLMSLGSGGSSNAYMVRGKDILFSHDQCAVVIQLTDYAHHRSKGQRSDSFVSPRVRQR